MWGENRTEITWLQFSLTSFSFSSSFRLVAIFKSYWGVQFQYGTDIKFTPPVCKSRSYKDAAVQRAETLHYTAALWCRALLALFLSKIFDRAAKFWKGGGGGGRERRERSLACQIILGVSMSVQSEAVNDVQTVGLCGNFESRELGLEDDWRLVHSPVGLSAMLRLTAAVVLPPPLAIAVIESARHWSEDIKLH